MIFVLLIILSLAIHISLEECLDKKVSIVTDLDEDHIVLPLKADFEQLLWHVAILKQGESSGEFLCSGTIVGHSHVVTAAPCVINVGISELRVVAGLTLLRSPFQAVENPHSVFNIVKKYYPFRTGNVVKDDLAVLKLEKKVTFKIPQFTTLDSKDKYSKQCFTLGWGLHNQSSDSSKCPNPSFQDSISNVLYDAEQNKPILYRILDVRNFMGLSSMFIFQLIKMLDILPQFPYVSKHSQDVTCPLGEFARIKAVKLSTKHPYKCLCHNTKRICLYSLAIDNIADQVDLGSPVFCKLKNPKTNKFSDLQPKTNKFAFAGIITNKKTEEVRWLRYGSSINMITATNVTMFTDFIVSVMLDGS